MNIVLVTDQYTDEIKEPKQDSSIFFAARYVEYLHALGNKVTVIATGRQQEGKISVASKSFWFIDYLTRAKGMVFGIPDDTKIREALSGADIVHLTLPYKLCMRAREIAKEMDIPYIASFYLSPQKIMSDIRVNVPFLKGSLYRRMRKRFYRHVSHIHCPSQSIANELKKHKYQSELHVVSDSTHEVFAPADAAKQEEASKIQNINNTAENTADGFAVQMEQLYQQIIEEKAYQKKHENDPDAHQIHLRQTLSFHIGEDYKFVNRNIFFLMFAYIFRFGLVYPVFYIITKIFLGLKSKGRGNLKSVKCGAVAVSNHVHIFDAPMLNFALFPRQPVMTSIKGNFQTPWVSFLVKTLGAAPIPETPKALNAFMNAMKDEISRKRIVHFYPEASLWPGYDKLRPFKNGAFHLAVKSNVPVLPMVVKQRKPGWFLKLFKNKPCISIIIGEPVFAPREGTSKARINKLRETVHEQMQKMLGGDVFKAEQQKEEDQITAAR